MGKHERDWAEVAEIEVADAINGKAASTASCRVADSIIHHVLANYNSPIKNAAWVGSESYDDKGDVHVFLENGTKIPVELKFSKSTGSGTKSNPSTNILPKKVSKTIENYQTFDKKLGLQEKRYSLVESKIGRKIKSAAEYQRALRQIREVEPEFLDKIVALTQPGKEAYTRYAANEMNKYLDKVNDMVADILNGDNTTSSVASSEELVYCVVKNYESGNQTVEFYDFDEMDSQVVNVVSSGFSIKLLNKAGKDVLRFVVHWKNICQGGATPCFNVFVGTAHG